MLEISTRLPEEGERSAMKQIEGKLAEHDFILEDESGDSDCTWGGEYGKKKEFSDIPFFDISASDQD